METIIHGGWLRKSPPEKRIWKGKWRRRWFVLRPSGQIPGQFVLDYFTDESCKKLKGHIDLDQCEQIDTGLPITENSRYKHVFDIRTPKRIYYLVADKEEDMNKWVEIICSVCDFKIHVDDPTAPSTPEPPPDVVEQQPSPTSTPDLSSISTCSPSGPYIPISECISGTSPLINGYADDRDDVFPDEVPPPPPKGGDRHKTHSGDFYDYPRQINPPGLDASRSVTDTQQQQSDGDDSWSTGLARPPKVNWDTYPRSVVESEPNFMNKGHTDIFNQPQTSIRPVTEMTATLGRLCFSETDCTLPAASSKPPPRPPKPKPSYLMGTSRLMGGGAQYWNGSQNKLLNYNNYDNIANCDLSSLYDVPPTAQGVFLSKNLPAKVFAHLKDDSIDLDHIPGVNGQYQVDEMYDFPRHLHDDQLNATPPAPTGETIWQRRHGYSNAPALLIMDGDGTNHGHNGKDYLSMDPHQQTGTEVYTDMSGEGRSPTSFYSNLPSPMHRIDNEFGPNPPPLVNRELKPKRKVEGISGKQHQVHQEQQQQGNDFSATNTLSAAEEKGALYHAPRVNRGLKPKRTEGLGGGGHSTHTPTTLTPTHTVISMNPPRGKRSFRKPRVSPSPNPSSPHNRSFNHNNNSMLSPNCRSTDRSSSDDDQSSSCSSRRNSSNDDHMTTKQVYGKSPSPNSSGYPRRTGKEDIQYLDLDLDSDCAAMTAPSPKSPEKVSSNTVYKTVDFIKTKAFNEMRQNVEANYRKSQ